MYVCMYVCARVCMVSQSACVLLALTFVDVESDGADCDADHAFRVVEKLNGLGVQGKVISVLCVGDREGAPVSKAQHCTAALRPQMTRERERQREQLVESEILSSITF